MNNDRAHIDAVAQTSPAAAALSTAPFALMKSQFAPAPPLRGSVEAAAEQSQSSGGTSVALEGSAAMEVDLMIDLVPVRNITGGAQIPAPKVPPSSVAARPKSAQQRPLPLPKGARVAPYPKPSTPPITTAKASIPPMTRPTYSSKNS